MAKANESEQEGVGGTSDPPAATQRRPYEKPRLRRYDKIEQVKPYGPSEL